MTTDAAARPGVVARFRSRQSGHPSGIVGRIFGRAMVKDTADANDQAIALLHLTAPRTVLEVGFGQGRTTAVLLDAGHHVIGVDPSATMVKQATARNRRACRDGRADLRHSDGITIAFDDHVADVAFSVHTVYFMPDPAATFADIARVLRPGGTLVIACRTSDTPSPAWMDPTIYRIPTAAQLTAMLNASGFDRVDQHTADDALHVFAAHLPNDAPVS
ncbi:MAG: class I SAM-dependent methyltransferase [Actinomycetota bacterium]|nr:class I SAM-dependent methyltransferase [Actinomycetota bacterium]